MVLIRLQDNEEDRTLLKRKLRAIVSQFVRLAQNKGAMQRAWRSMRESFKWVLRRGLATGAGKRQPKYANKSAVGCGIREISQGEDVNLLSQEQGGGMLHKPSQAPSLDQLTSDHLALIVDGETLLKIFGDAETEKLFLSVATICKSVIACRVSPEQKRLMVRLVKRGVYPRPVTLSIGDGANDVAMIQEAQIGVGISGKEGRQAVNSSDFAIAQFRFLKRLMLVHGRTDYRRTCKVVLYSFYKNIVLTLVLFAYTFFSGYSGQSLFDDYIYSSYNIILALPVVAFGVFDVDIAPFTLEKYNLLYVSGREGLDMNVFVLLKEMLQAIVDATIVFFVPYFCYSDPADVWSGPLPLTSALSSADSGKTAGIWVFGTTVFTALLLSMFLRAAMLTYTWTYITHACFWGSILLYIFFVYFYQYMLSISYNFYGAADAMWSQPSFYWICLLVPSASLLVELAYRLAKRELFPSIVDIAIEFDAGYSGAGKTKGLLFEEMNGCTEPQSIKPLQGSQQRDTNAYSPSLDLDLEEEEDDSVGRREEVGAALLGYSSDGSVSSIASETLETSLRYSSVLSGRGGLGKGKVPLDWQSVKLLKAALTTHEQQALGLHDGPPDTYYNYDHYSTTGYGPGSFQELS